MTNKNTPALIEEISPITKQAESITIATQADLVEATETLSRLNTSLDKVTAEKERVTKPLNEALKAERSRWKPIETMLETAIASIRLKMTEYQTLLINAQKAEEEAIASRIGEGKGKIKLDTALRKLSEVEKAPKQVNTDTGSLTFISTPKLKITDPNQVPDEYWIIDESSLFRDLKTGKAISGAEIEIIQVPRNNR